MSGGLLRYVIALVFAFHGVGQVMGIIPALKLSFITNSGHATLQHWSAHSWLLTPMLGETVSRLICVALFGISFLGFMAATLSLMNWLLPHDLWRSLAIASAVVSTIALLLYWNALVLLVPHKVGDIAVNLAVLIGLLVLNWPDEKIFTS